MQPVIVPEPKVDQLYRDELLQIIQWGIDVHPRSSQFQVGPSEIGGCQTKLAWKLAYGGAGEQEGGWASHKGTVLHAWLDQVYDGHVIGDKLPTMPDGSPRFFSDLKLSPISPDVNGGTLDLYDKLRETIVDWKALALDTEMPTPSGWATVESLRVGNQVFGSDGLPCEVLAKTNIFVGGETYEVKTSSGEVVTCDGGHLWSVDIQGSIGSRVVTTRWMADRLRVRGEKQRDIRIAVNGSLDLPDVELPVAPYLFGLWLGDGESDTGRLGLGGQDAEELFGYVEADGDTTIPSAPRADGFQRRRVEGLTRALSGMGLVSRGKGPKAIPEYYLRASRQQRLALLRGLMDSDGTYNRRRYECIFTQKDPALTRQVAELVRSLGWKAYVWQGRAHGFGKDSTQCQLHFSTGGDSPFRLKRKRDLVRPGASALSRTHIVQSVEKVASRPVQCISVSSPDSTFLIGRTMTPTHNCPGDWTMKNVRSGKLSEGYYVQAQTYATTLMRNDPTMKVSRIALMFLPMCGDNLKGAGGGAVFRYWDYDPTVCDEAMANVARIKNMLAVATPQKVMEVLPKKSDFCQSCAAFVGSGDRRAVCPGVTPQRAKTNPNANPFG